MEPITAPSSEPAKPAQQPVQLNDWDDEDEALQAVLLASLQAEATQEAPQASTAAQEEQEARLNAAVKPPLVAAPTAIDQFCKDASFGDVVQHSLLELGKPPNCLRLVKVRGDGHCLFRVVGAALVLSAAWAGRAAVDALIGHLHSPLVHASCAEVARLVTELVRERDVLAALNDEYAHRRLAPARCVACAARGAKPRWCSSPRSVMCCHGWLTAVCCCCLLLRAGRRRARRTSSCARCVAAPSATCARTPSDSVTAAREWCVHAAAHAQRPRRTFARDLSRWLAWCARAQEGDGEAAWEAYCAAIEDASTARYGGHPELVALSESVRVRVDVYDTGALSGQTLATYRLGEHLPEGVPTVRGLRRGPHFDLLLRAQSEGDATNSPSGVAEID
jgi:hypothetical protein